VEVRLGLSVEEAYQESLHKLRVQRLYFCVAVRSVMIRTWESPTCSRIHLASHTIVRLLPEPWVRQMMPPSDVILSSTYTEILVVAAELFVPASNTMKS
jgi:hypothetical protein